MRELVYIQQPEGSNLCGQACVAMLAGVTLQEAIDVFGTVGATRTKQIIRALRCFDIKCGDKLFRLRRGVTKTAVCIVRLHFKGAIHSHWTLWYHGCFYDPEAGIFQGKYPDPDGLINEDSFLPVYLSTASRKTRL